MEIRAHFLRRFFKRRLSLSALLERPNSEALLVACAGIVFGLAFSLPVLVRLSSVATYHDWDLHSELHSVSVYTVTHFHQFPFWNPYECGGIPMLANPHSRILTPFFLLSLLSGPWVGLHLEIMLHLAAAWIGGYVLARVQGMGPAAGVVCGSVFAGSSWFPLHIAVGHTPFMSFAYLPWIAASIWLGIARHRLFPAVIAGSLVALTLGEGGVYAIPQAFLLAFSLCLFLLLFQRNFWPISVCAVFTLFALGFAAIKLIPTHELLQQYSRPWPDPGNAASLRLLLQIFFSRDQYNDRQLVGLAWGFWEYGAYVGPLAAALAVVGITTSTRRMIPWLAVGLLFLGLAIGNGGSYYPWVLLHKLPLFSSERAPSRVVIPVTLTIGVCAGAGAGFIESRFKWRGAVVLYLLIAAMIGDFWLVGVPNLAYSFRIDRPAAPWALSGRYLGRGPVTDMPQFRQFRNLANYSMLGMGVANEGSIDCYEYTTIVSPARGFGQPGYHGEQYLLNPGEVKLIRWTPDKLSYVVDTPTSNTLVVNQNFDTGWHLRDGIGWIVPIDGLLAVAMPPGKQTIALVYRPTSFFVGSAITVFTFLMAFWVWRRDKEARA